MWHRKLYIAGLVSLTAMTSVMSAPVGNGSAADDDGWTAYKLRHSKNYTDDAEDLIRRQIRQRWLPRIQAHNEEAARGLHSYTVAENHLTDLNPGEYKRMMGLRRRSEGDGLVDAPSMPIYQLTINVSSLPAEVDWRTKGCVGPVRDQGNWGTGYSYAVVGAIEAQIINNGGELRQLSEQHLIECSQSEGNFGLLGGFLANSFWFVQNHSIASRNDYPNVTDSPLCKFNETTYRYNMTTIHSWRSIGRGDELALQQAVALIGPVAVGVSAGLDSCPKFRAYAGGIFDMSDCIGQSVDHAVLVVGYGVSNSTPYWLIKNSWGTGWGMNGYMMLARNVGMCGIGTDAVFPLLAPDSNGLSTVTTSVPHLMVALTTASTLLIMLLLQ